MDVDVHVHVCVDVDTATDIDTDIDIDIHISIDIGVDADIALDTLYRHIINIDISIRYIDIDMFCFLVSCLLNYVRSWKECFT